MNEKKRSQSGDCDTGNPPKKTKSVEENENHENEILSKCKSIPDAALYYLCSKTRSFGRDLKFDEVFEMYQKLNEIVEIKAIFNVVQFAESLDIILNFSDRDISKIYPEAAIGFSKDSCVSGRYVRYKNRIYVGAKVENEKIYYGTLVHELTHMAMEILFKNNSNPYKISGHLTSKFDEIIKTTEKAINVIK